MTRLKSFRTGEPSENLTSSGITVHPSRAPVKPAYLENEFTCLGFNSSHQAMRLRLMQRSLHVQQGSIKACSQFNIPTDVSGVLGGGTNWM